MAVSLTINFGVVAEFKVSFHKQNLNIGIIGENKNKFYIFKIIIYTVFANDELRWILN